MAGGGKQPTQQTVTQTNLPEYARPYFMDLMRSSSGLLSQPYIPFGFTQNKETGEVERAIDPATGQPVNADRIADFTPQQRQVQQNILSQQTPGEFGTAGGLATAAGLGSLQAAQFAPGQFSFREIGLPNLQQFSMSAPGMVQGGQYNAPSMGTAQTGFSPNLQYFQMEGPQAFGLEQARQYMSPFIEQALEPQLRSAVSDAKRAQLAQNLGAARQGTYGGSRQLLATLERESDLAQQMGDIRARGLETAFGQAQQQFERDRAARMMAGQTNLQSALGVQQLGTQTAAQMALANLDAASQANVQNLAAQLQTQGLNADQALRAALANQQAELTVGQQNLQSALQTQQLGTQAGLEALRANQQADLERQRMGEQSRQFGAQQALAGLAQAGQMGQTLTNIGSARSQADLARLGQQTQTAAQEQALNQQLLDTRYQEFLRQRDYPLEMLQQYSSLLRGVPVTPGSTQTTYAQPPSVASQLMGVGLGGLGLARTLGA